MSIRVPEDYKTLAEAVIAANKTDGTSRAVACHRIILSAGVHPIAITTNIFGYELNYVEIKVPLTIEGHPDQIAHKTIVQGGFLVTSGRSFSTTSTTSTTSSSGDNNAVVLFKNMTIQQSMDSAIFGFHGLSIKTQDVVIEDCDGRGIVAQGTSCHFAGTIERCGMSGLCACEGGEIVVSCTESATNSCTCPKHHPCRTRIESNCAIGWHGDFGLLVEDTSSIHFIHPLTKEHVSSRNGGGGNWGGFGVIDQTRRQLRQKDTIYVPEEETSLQGAIDRARRTHKGRQTLITKIVLKYGHHTVNTVRGKYVEIDFSPLEIVGGGNDRTFLNGGGIKITGEKEYGGPKYPIKIRNLAIVDAGGSGVFCENGLPVLVDNVSMITVCSSFFSSLFYSFPVLLIYR